MRKAVGYCENIKCNVYLKGTFLLNHGDTFYCPRCRSLSSIVEESFTNEDTCQGVYKTVKVRFDYNPANKKYSYTAIVDIAELPYGGVYTYSSPLIKTEKRAIIIAEHMITQLNSGARNPSIMTQPTLIHMDKPMDSFKEELSALSESLEIRDKNLKERITYG